tara:strand:+ start:3559 stop:4551 length:993 start_codon:yes stop_codon:yes gene_type:complete
VIPCFNQGAFLGEAVQSALDQTYPEVEVLVLDDGSTDPETQRLLSEFKRPKTRVFREPNRGLGAARNFLIERSQGELICALDADDRLHPELFEAALERFGAEPDLSFVSSWVELFGEEEWIWRQTRCDLVTLLVEDTVMTPALVRRQAVVESGGYAEDMPHMGDEDWELWLRLVKEGHRGAILPRVLFHYRQREGSMARDCTRGRQHLDLTRDRIERHREAYRTHLDAVLAQQNETLAELVAETHAMETDARTREELVTAQRAELAELEAQLADPTALSALRAENRRLRESLDVLDAERRALRDSASWRLTRPLRRGLDLLRRLRGRGPS